MKMVVGHMHGESNLCEFNEQKVLRPTTSQLEYSATGFIIFSLGIHILAVNRKKDDVLGHKTLKHHLFLVIYERLWR